MSWLAKKKNRATYRAVFILADYILLQNRPTSRRGYYSYYVFIVDYHSFIHSERITTVITNVITKVIILTFESLCQASAVACSLCRVLAEAPIEQVIIFHALI